MDVTVTKVEDAAATVPAHPFAGPIDPASPPAPTPKSPLAELRSRRKAQREQLHTDLQVPRYGTDEMPGPEVFVRYRPVDQVMFEDVIERRGKQGKGWTLWAYADILAHCCQGVFACISGDYGRKYSLAAADKPDLTLDEALNVPWTKFDSTLRDSFLLESEVTCSTASDICKALYLTDGDLIAAANALLEWSGISSEKLDEDF